MDSLEVLVGGVSVTQEQKIMMIGLLSFAPVYLLVTWSLTFLLSVEY